MRETRWSRDYGGSPAPGAARSTPRSATTSRSSPRPPARLDRADRNRRRVRFAVTMLVFLTLGLSEGLGFRVFDTLGRSWSALQNYLFPVEYDLEPGGGQHVYRLGTKVEVAIKITRGPD